MRVQLQLLVLLACVLGSGVCLSQPAARVASQPFPPSPARGPGHSRHLVSPTDYIRQLLAMSPAEREKALNERMERDRKFFGFSYRNRPELSREEREKLTEEKARGLRRFWEAKVKEYEALPPVERELRLRTTHQTARLRMHLKPLMQMPPERRAERLAAIPADERPLVEERLKEWDRLAPQLQKQILENEFIMQDVARLEQLPEGERETALQAYSNDYRRRVEENLARWHALPKEQRQQMYENFNRFFQLSEKEKDRTLESLSAGERQALAKSLEQFEKLPADQRKTCIESFRKFSNMTPEQRAEFLKNAERWKAMSPTGRESWRALAPQLPPLPPGLVMPPLPPLPPFPETFPPLPASTNRVDK